MSTDPYPSVTARTIGFFGALGIGVGAMVGGGILALAGVAFAVSGPSAILAFALNGLIAFITALSFAEIGFGESAVGRYLYLCQEGIFRFRWRLGWAGLFGLLRW